MSRNYSPELPRDKGDAVKQNYPPSRIALAVTHKENTGSSSVLQFTHNTTEIEVTTTGLGVAGKWAGAATPSVVTSNAGTPNFDFIVPVATTRRFIVPQSITGYPQSVQGLNRLEGLYQGVAYISITGGNGSVLTAEF